MSCELLLALRLLLLRAQLELRGLGVRTRLALLGLVAQQPVGGQLDGRAVAERRAGGGPLLRLLLTRLGVRGVVRRGVRVADLLPREGLVRRLLGLLGGLGLRLGGLLSLRGLLGLLRSRLLLVVAGLLLPLLGVALRAGLRVAVTGLLSLRVGVLLSGRLLRLGLLGVAVGGLRVAVSGLLRLLGRCALLGVATLLRGRLLRLSPAAGSRPAVLRLGLLLRLLRLRRGSLRLSLLGLLLRMTALGLRHPRVRGLVLRRQRRQCTLTGHTLLLRVRRRHPTEHPAGDVPAAGRPAAARPAEHPAGAWPGPAAAAHPARARPAAAAAGPEGAGRRPERLPRGPGRDAALGGGAVRPQRLPRPRRSAEPRGHRSPPRPRAPRSPTQCHRRRPRGRRTGRHRCRHARCRNRRPHPRQHRPAPRRAPPARPGESPRPVRHRPPFGRSVGNPGGAASAGGGASAPGRPDPAHPAAELRAQGPREGRPEPDPPGAGRRRRGGGRRRRRRRRGSGTRAASAGVVARVPGRSREIDLEFTGQVELGLVVVRIVPVRTESLLLVHCASWCTATHLNGRTGYRRIDRV